MKEVQSIQFKNQAETKQWRENEGRVLDMPSTEIMERKWESSRAEVHSSQICLSKSQD